MTEGIRASETEARFCKEFDRKARDIAFKREFERKLKQCLKVLQ